MRYMALGRRCRDSEAKNGRDSELIALGAVRAARGLKRKRIGISKEEKKGCCSDIRSSIRRQCSEKFDLDSEISPLEALPQDVLIKVLCGVEHADLKHLVLVSRPVLDATLVAKRLHFEYSTPRKVKAFKNPIDMEESGEELEVPDEPRRRRKCRRRISLETQKHLAVALFQSDGEEKWLRRGLRFIGEDECI